MFNLAGKQALITGGNSGIGLGIAKALAKAGAGIVIVGKDKEKNKYALEILRKINNSVVTTSFDLSQLKKIQYFFNKTENRYGLFDILINCAGITVRKRSDLFTLEEWQKVMDLNLTSTFLLTIAWAKSLIEKKKTGCCIIILSLMSEAVRSVTPAYSASKAALKQLVKAFAVDWAQFGIRVNGITPGYIRTDLTEALYRDRSFNDWVINRTPLRRWGSPDDIGPAAVFLCSDEASFITGQTIIIDGGFLAML